jgi:hypothetical protein
MELSNALPHTLCWLGAQLIKRTDNTACYMMMNRVCCRMTNCNDNEGIRLHTSDDNKEYTTNTVIYNCKEQL